MMAQRNRRVHSSVLEHVTKHLRIFAPLLATAALVAAGCGGGSSSATSSYDGSQAVYQTKPKAAKTAAAAAPATAQAPRVAIKDSSFQPNRIKLHAGQKVTFVNDDEIAHTVTAQDGTFDSGTLQQGAKFSFTAKKAGTISYVCSFHPRMTGTIEVS
jgi:plastocyanin